MDPEGKNEGLYDRVTRGIRKLESRIDSVLLVHGQMLLFRRSIDLVPRTGIASDDVDLSLQARRKGYRIRYAAGARFWEERPSDRLARQKQGKRHGMSIAQVLWRNRDMVGKRRYGAFGLLSLPFEWVFLIAQPIMAALILTVAFVTGLVFAPAASAAAVVAFGVLAAGSKGVRSYLIMNGLMLSAIVSLAAGGTASDRWPRDRDGGQP